VREEKPYIDQRRRREFSSLAKETRLGEFFSLLVFWVHNGMICSVNCMNIMCFCMNYCVSGKIPETAWRAMHNYHATPLVLVFLGSYERNRLAVHSRPPGGAWHFYPILGFWMKSLAVPIKIGKFGEFDTACPIGVAILRRKFME